MENQYGRRLGKTVDMLEQIEQEMAEADIGTATVVYDTKIVKRLDGYFASFIPLPDLNVVGGGVVDVLNKLSKLQDATLTVAERGRAYTTKDGRVTVQVWAKDPLKLEAVKEVYGGNHYKHGSGSVWILSKQSALMDMWVKVRHYLVRGNLLILEVAYEVFRQSEHEAPIHPSGAATPSNDSGTDARREPKDDNGEGKVGRGSGQGVQQE